ncbi:MAG: hypothetical protein KZQ60_06650 [Candidatus Thiodiazotropha sp. (ex Lucinoma aequizonata)]|nr:hypothetical protein [Candidatus Thiodiazotropha sp. (ex Lucinoma aequizonata)]
MNGCFDASQQQIIQIRRFYSIPKTPDSVITRKAGSLPNLIRRAQSADPNSKFIIQNLQLVLQQHFFHIPAGGANMLAH